MVFSVFFSCAFHPKCGCLDFMVFLWVIPYFRIEISSTNPFSVESKAESHADLRRSALFDSGETVNLDGTMDISKQI